MVPINSSANGIGLGPSTVPWVARDGSGVGKVLLDLNGDGLADAVEFSTMSSGSSSRSTYFVNTGRGMLGGTANFSDPVDAKDLIYADNDADYLIVMDVNQDGRDDIVSAGYLDSPPEIPPLRVFLSNGTGLSKSTTISLNPKDGGGTIKYPPNTKPNAFRSFDANGDGLADFMMSDGENGPATVYLHDGKKADMITSFNNGAGSSFVVTYSPWAKPEDSTSPATCQYPVRCPARGPWVVSSYYLYTGPSEGPPKYTYTYDLAAIDMLGRGWLGFGERTVTHVNSGQVTSYVTSNMYRRGSSYPYAGRPGTVEKQILLENGALLTGTTTTGYDLISGNIDTPGHAFAIGPLAGTDPGQRLLVDHAMNVAMASYRFG